VERFKGGRTSDDDDDDAYSGPPSTVPCVEGNKQGSQRIQDHRRTIIVETASEISFENCKDAMQEYFKFQPKNIVLEWDQELVDRWTKCNEDQGTCASEIKCFQHYVINLSYLGPTIKVKVKVKV
jgi:hypothetical protein